MKLSRMCYSRSKECREREREKEKGEREMASLLTLDFLYAWELIQKGNTGSSIPE